MGSAPWMRAGWFTYVGISPRRVMSRAMALAWYPLPVGTTWRVVGALETTRGTEKDWGVESPVLWKL